MLRFLTAGESHGRALVVIVEGLPAGLPIAVEQVQAEVTRYVAATHPQSHVLLIGGGGYTYPRWVERFVPQATMEVVEIDPGVTEVNYREMGMPRDTRIVSHNLDHVFRLSTHIAVMRLGRLVGVRETERTTRSEVLHLISGIEPGSTS